MGEPAQDDAHLADFLYPRRHGDPRWARGAAGACIERDGGVIAENPGRGECLGRTGELSERRHIPSLGHSEDRAEALGSATSGGSVKVAGAALHQFSLGSQQAGSNRKEAIRPRKAIFLLHADPVEHAALVIGRGIKQRGSRPSRNDSGGNIVPTPRREIDALLQGVAPARNTRPRDGH